MLIDKSGERRYTVRNSESITDFAELRQGIVDALARYESAPTTIVDLWYPADPSLDALFFDHEPQSLGWEGLILPGSNSGRRGIRLPSGVSVTPGIRQTDPHRLQTVHPWARENYNDPSVDHDESMVIYRDDDFIGWIPVWRLSSHTSLVRHCLIEQHVYHDEIRRRTVLRLATYARAVDHQLAQNRSVISWLPDDGDEVNDFKLQIGAPALLTHWMFVRTRCDLKAP